MLEGNGPLRNTLLKALEESDRAAIVPHLERMTLAQGTVLAEVNEMPDYVWFPHTAIISLTVPMLDGRGAETATIGREGMANFVICIGSGVSFTRSIVQIAGDADRIKCDAFSQLLSESPDLVDRCRAYIEAVFGQITQSVACNALHGLEARLSRWLLMFDDRSKGDVLRLTQEFLAEMLGVQRTTVTLAARSLQNAGLIHYARGRINVIDRAGLERTSCECYGAVRRHFERLLPHTYSD